MALSAAKLFTLLFDRIAIISVVWLHSSSILRNPLASMQATLTRPPRTHSTSEVRRALRTCRAAFFGVALFSAIGNVLILAGPIYMLQLYDRVLTSRSVPTLVGLTLALLILYVGYWIFDILRLRLLTRIGVRLERQLRSRVLAIITTAPLRTRASETLQPMRDLDQIRSFLSGLGPTALFDFPWMPLYLSLIYIMHPWLGILGIAGGLTLVGLTILTETRGSAPTREAAAIVNSRQAFGESVRRNAEVIQALGMRAYLSQRWDQLSESQLTWQTRRLQHVAMCLRAMSCTALCGQCQC